MRKLYIFGLIGLAIFIIDLAWAEQITFTTYYPAPFGVYNQMVTKVLGVGDNDHSGTIDSGDVPNVAGNVWIEGNVGIQTDGNFVSDLNVGGSGHAGTAIYGIASTTGVWGEGDIDGVYGHSSDGRGVRGVSSEGHGVYGHSREEHGVHGNSTFDVGVWGKSGDEFLVWHIPPAQRRAGVRGFSDNFGVHGRGSMCGVVGETDQGFGVEGRSRSGYGIYGWTNSGHAGHFDGDVMVDGIIHATSSRTKKTNITPLSPKEYQEFLRKLENIEIVQYDLKGQVDSPDAKRHIGIISEDAPDEITSKDKKAIDIGDYLGFLLAAVKAQNEEIKTLRQQMSRLGQNP